MKLSALEICAGGGGQALGLEMAGFDCAAAVEIDVPACETLRLNRPKWKILNRDIRELDGREYRGIDLLAGGVPCPPFSIAGKQLGHEDDRDLFPEAIRLIEEARPAAVMLENVPGLASDRFRIYRHKLAIGLCRLGYEIHWETLNACDFGVPQLRPRFITVALKGAAAASFAWPEARKDRRVTVGSALSDLMRAKGWIWADEWSRRASQIAPTIVGGSKKHGGPDLGPTRARRQWAALGVDGLGIADLPPPPDFPRNGMPRLTIRMVARIQGFPDSWHFYGKKTAAYRQVGNAFPPPVAAEVGAAIYKALNNCSKAPLGRGNLSLTA